jgi:hypothetical protein
MPVGAHNRVVTPNYSQLLNNENGNVTSCKVGQYLNTTVILTTAALMCIIGCDDESPHMA